MPLLRGTDRHIASGTLFALGGTLTNSILSLFYIMLA